MKVTRFPTFERYPWLAWVVGAGQWFVILFWCVLFVLMPAAILATNNPPFDRTDWRDAKQLFAWSMMAWVVTSIAALILRKEKPDKPRGKAWLVVGVLIVLIPAILPRALAMRATPTLSNDIWRFIHDGATLASGKNPRLAGPLEMQSSPAGETVHSRVNNPVTIYGPTGQWFFALSWWLHNPDIDPTGDRTLRAMLLIADAAIIAMLMWKRRCQGYPTIWAALWAWHPLVVLEIAGSGHQDVLGIAWLMLSFLMADHWHARASPAKSDAPAKPRGYTLIFAAVCGVAFALALGVKPIVAPLALALMWPARKNVMSIIAFVIATAATIAALYFPLVLMESGLAGMFKSAVGFGDTRTFNGSLFNAFISLGVPAVAAKMVGVAVTLGVLIFMLRARFDPWNLAVVFFLVSLLMSSTVHPWYLLWALAFVPARFNLAVWVWSATILLSYFHQVHAPGSDSAIGPSMPRAVAQYLPVYAALAWGVYRWWKANPRRVGHHAVQPPSTSRF